MWINSGLQIQLFHSTQGYQWSVQVDQIYPIQINNWLTCLRLVWYDQFNQPVDVWLGW